MRTTGTMNPALRRTKMVSFRLSGAEFQKFQNLCGACGARNVSDLTRKAVQRFLSAQGDADPLWWEVQELRDQVRSVSSDLDRLAKVIEAREAAARNGRGGIA